MLKKPSIVTRIFIGKSIGLLIGLIAFFMIPTMMPEASPLLHWGVLLWYITFGAIIGLFGLLDWHPILKFKLQWWMRGIILGGWLNFVLTFFAHEPMKNLLDTLFGLNSTLDTPLLFVLEGMLFGSLIDYAATQLGGEGKDCLDDAPGKKKDKKKKKK